MQTQKLYWSYDPHRSRDSMSPVCGTFFLKVKEDEGKEDKIKEQFFVCSQCNYKSKKEGLFKKHMLTKHKDLICRECKEKFPSPMELLKHVAKHHINESNKAKDLKDKGEEAIHIEENQDKVDMKDSDEVKIIKRTKKIETTDKEERNKSFVFSESQFFDKFLSESSSSSNMTRY